MYICIDLKTFFASVECVDRGLDPFKTNLVVSDPQRGSGALCLAITPALKNLGIRNRCQLFEIPKGIDYIIAKPRMKLYIDYSAKIYGLYLRYISKDDIHVYSIDEVFIDISKYLKLYNMDSFSFSKFLIDKVYEEFKIVASVGIGVNLYLAKIALDLISKKSNDNIGYLDEKLYLEKLGNHKPLKDFWYISNGIQQKLNNLNIYTMNDIINSNHEILYKTFGVNAEILIDHALGIEPVTIKDIKSYKRKSNSRGQSQVLFKDYTFNNARLILKEMVDLLSLDLVDKNLVSNNISLSVGYTKDICKRSGGSRKIPITTNIYKLLIPYFLDLYDKTTRKDTGIRTISISLNNCISEDYEQFDLFTNIEEASKEKKLEKVINDIKKKFGKNSILKGMNYLEDATTIERNKLIGGHNSGEDDE